MTVKKIMGICLVAALLLTALALLPISARAETASGTCGKNLTWTLDESGTLTISGTGEMSEYAQSIGAPWNPYKDSILTLVVQDGVTSVGAWAFQECTALKNVVLGSGVLRIDDYAFIGCENMVSLDLPDGLTHIGEGAFQACKALSTIEFPDSVSSVGQNALRGCGNLRYVTLPAGLTKISGSMFYQCNDLEEIVIPEGVKEIGMHAFQYCSALREVTLPDSVTIIQSYAFASCGKLTAIDLPDGLTYLGTGAFQECTLLKSVTIPEKITVIEAYSFCDCLNLTTVTLPSELVAIYGNAFSDCAKLWHVFFDGTEAQWNAIKIDFGNDALQNAIRHASITDDMIFNPGTENCQFCCQLGKHNFVGERVEPTCTADGSFSGACRSCGEKITEVIPAIEHNYVVSKKVKPTFFADGYTCCVCSDCGITSIKHTTSAQGKVMLEAILPIIAPVLQYAVAQAILTGIIFFIGGLYKLWQRKRKKR